MIEAVFDSVSDGICVIDKDDYRIVKANKAFIATFGPNESEVIGRCCFDVAHAGSEPCQGPDEDCPLIETVKTGATASAEHVHYDKDGRKLYVEVSTSPIKNQNGQFRHVIHTTHDITDLKRVEEELRQTVSRLTEILEGVVQAMATTVETRDPYTAGHEQQVSRLACAIGKKLGMGKGGIECLRIAGLLHDLGKISVPTEILCRPGKLSTFEFSLVKLHPEAGHDILKTIEFPWPIAEIVLQHHERFGGGGYPRGLSGEEILLEARIIGVADTVEAMASHRPYRPALGIEAALKEISDNRGVIYDPLVVDACIKVFEEGFSFGAAP